jgi:hypothetical protein
MPERCPVGLVENKEGIHFQCGTCEYYDRKVCHNPDLRLHMRHVEPEWCCNLYHHTGMKTKVK